MTRLDVVCVLSVVVAFVTEGPADVTVIAALAAGPFNPPTALVVDS